MSMQRVMIFIDGSNVHWGIKGYNKDKNTNMKIDYTKLISLLQDGRTLIRVIYYCSKPIPPGSQKQVNFYTYLRGIGIQVVEKELKIRTYADGSEYAVEKGVDVALATDLIGMAWENAYDVAVIVSGDADYSGAVGKVMSKGKNVEIASFRRCLSRELRETGLRTKILDDYITQIAV